MVFRSGGEIFGQLPEGEPFIVPLAIPSIAGPTAIATVVVLASSAPLRWPEWTIAVFVAVRCRSWCSPSRIASRARSASARSRRSNG